MLFIIIDNQYDGVISINELSWLKKPPHPSKILNQNQEIEVLVIDIDEEKKRVNCSLKQIKKILGLNLKKILILMILLKLKL